MPATAIKALVLLEQGLIGKSRRVMMKGGDRRIELAVEQRAFEADRLVDPEGDMDGRRGFGEAPQRGGDAALGISRGVVDRAEAERPDGLALERRDLASKCLMRSEQALGGGMHRPALLGQPEPGPAALAKLEAEPLLELRHLTGDSGGAHIELRLRRGESATGDDRLKHPQELHIRFVDARGHGHVSRLANYCSDISSLSKSAAAAS